VTPPPEVWLPCALGLASGLVAAVWMVRISRPGAIAPELPPELLEAMREVDAMLPGTPPISPQMPAVQRRAIEEAEKKRRFIASLVPPDAVACGVWPRPKPEPRSVRTVKDGTIRTATLDVPTWSSIDRRPPPPRPMPTSAPGRGTLAQS
jgi:hypothetical protein